MARRAPWLRKEPQSDPPFSPGGSQAAAQAVGAVALGGTAPRTHVLAAVVPPLRQVPSSVPGHRQGWGGGRHGWSSVGAWLWLCGLSAGPGWAEGTDHPQRLVLSAPGTPAALPQAHWKATGKAQTELLWKRAVPFPTERLPTSGAVGQSTAPARTEAAAERRQGFVLNCHVRAEGQGLLHAGAALPPLAAGTAGVPGSVAGARP